MISPDNNVRAFLLSFFIRFGCIRPRDGFVRLSNVFCDNKPTSPPKPPTHTLKQYSLE